MNNREKAEELFDVILKTGKSLTQIPMDCSQGETGTLLYLTFKKDGITATELSEILKVSLPRIVSLLNNLESKQLIKKIIDDNDKRKTIIYITETGKQLILEKKEKAICKMAQIIEKLDDKEISQYIHLVKKIGSIIIEMQE